jgi:adenine-specific DNA glycosylase
MQAFIVLNRSRYLAVQRPQAGINGGLWEFPSLELKSGRAATPKPPSQVAGVSIRKPRLLGTLHHSITRYRFKVDVYNVTLVQPDEVSHNCGRWVTRAELMRLPFSAAHRRIADTLLPEDIAQ